MCLMSQYTQCTDQAVVYALLPLKYRFLFDEIYMITRYFSENAQSYSTECLMYEKNKQTTKANYWQCAL